MNNMNIGTDTSATLTPDFFEEVTDEIKCISFTIFSIGDSVASTGLPADTEIFSQTLAKLSLKLDAVAKMLETVSADMKNKDGDHN